MFCTTAKCKSELLLPFRASNNKSLNYLCIHIFLQSKVCIELFWTCKCMKRHFWGLWCRLQVVFIFSSFQLRYGSIIVNEFRRSETSWRQSGWHMVQFQPFIMKNVLTTMACQRMRVESDVQRTFINNLQSETLKHCLGLIQVRFSENCWDWWLVIHRHLSVSSSTSSLCIPFSLYFFWLWVQSCIASKDNLKQVQFSLYSFASAYQRFRILPSIAYYLLSYSLYDFC